MNIKNIFSCALISGVLASSTSDLIFADNNIEVTSNQMGTISNTFVGSCCSTLLDFADGIIDKAGISSGDGKTLVHAGVGALVGAVCLSVFLIGFKAVGRAFGANDSGSGKSPKKDSGYIYI